MTYAVVALDAMGVLYRAADDVTDILIPYAQAHGSGLTATAIHEAYVEASLGRLTSAELWRRIGVAGAPDADYCLLHDLADGVLPALERLSNAGVPLACLSNDVSEWSLELRRRFGLERLIDTWVISGDIGVRKPSPLAYEALATTVDAAPAGILFVDDRMANVRAARAAGMSAALFGGRTDRDEDGCATVCDMAALADAVLGIR